jgi:hypothetical protein
VKRFDFLPLTITVRWCYGQFWTKNTLESILCVKCCSFITPMTQKLKSVCSLLYLLPIFYSKWQFPFAQKIFFSKIKKFAYHTRRTTDRQRTDGRAGHLIHTHFSQQEQTHSWRPCLILTVVNIGLQYNYATCRRASNDIIWSSYWIIPTISTRAYYWNFLTIKGNFGTKWPKNTRFSVTKHQKMPHKVAIVLPLTSLESLKAESLWTSVQKWPFWFRKS